MNIKSRVIRSIFEQGEREAPLEACGYLAGKDSLAVKNYPMRNIDRSSEHFSLDPKEQFAVIRQARAEGMELLAVYHTHPGTPARPSREDIRLAYDRGIVYVIASLVKGEETIKAFRIGQGNVTEENLIIED